jgi:hypothetical protein
MTILAVIIKTLCIISGGGEEATANSFEYRTTPNNVLSARWEKRSHIKSGITAAIITTFRQGAS